MKKKDLEVVIEDEEFQNLREEFMIPFSCPACKMMLDNWSNQFFYKWGVCADCSIEHLEDRKWPEEFKKDRKKILEYVKEKINNIGK